MPMTYEKLQPSRGFPDARVRGPAGRPIDRSIDRARGAARTIETPLGRPVVFAKYRELFLSESCSYCRHCGNACIVTPGDKSPGINQAAKMWRRDKDPRAHRERPVSA